VKENEKQNDNHMVGIRKTYPPEGICHGSCVQQKKYIYTVLLFPVDVMEPAMLPGIEPTAIAI
jgi:hypothetical protein